MRRAWSGTPWFAKLATPETMYGAESGAFAAKGISEGIGDPDSHLYHATHTNAVIVSLIVAGSGIFLAYFLYVRRRDLPAKITGKRSSVGPSLLGVDC